MEENKQITTGRMVNDIIQVLCRYGLAFCVAIYGSAKLFHGQFLLSDTVLDRPVSELDGFSLTWAFFGRSFEYDIFIGLSQILAASLLLFRRTKLVGLMLLIPILLNIAIVDVLYGIPFGATISAILYLLVAIYLLLCDYKKLIAFFFQKQEWILFPVKRKILFNVTRYTIRALVIGVPFTAMMIGMSYSKEGLKENPFLGKWKVVSDSTLTGPLREIELIYFDMRSSVLKTHNDFKESGYNYDAAKKTIKLLHLDPVTNKKARLLQGTYEFLNDSNCVLKSDSLKISLKLIRVKKAFPELWE